MSLQLSDRVKSLTLTAFVLVLVTGCGGATAEQAKQLDTLTRQLARQDERLGALQVALTELELRVAGARAPGQSTRVTRQDATDTHELPSRLALVRLEPAASPPMQLSLDESESSPAPLQIVKVAPAPPSVARARAVDAPKDELAKGEVVKAPSPVLASGLEAFEAGRFDEALTAFTAFLANSPRAAGADRARYWSGEANFELGRYEEAIACYRRLTAEHPKSQKAAEALLRTGIAYERLGNAPKAHSSFESLLKGYPDSAVAEIARARLAVVRGGGIP